MHETHETSLMPGLMLVSLLKPSLPLMPPYDKLNSEQAVTNATANITLISIIFWC